MHILFEAKDKKGGMTLGELMQNLDRAKTLSPALADKPVKFQFNFNGTVKTFEIEAE